MPERMRDPSPMHYASGYTLDLYCDHINPRHPFNAFPHTFVGETFAECARQARAKGWDVHHRDRTATCPICLSESRQARLKRAGRV